MKRTSRLQQGGVVLIEALVAILIFALGIMGMLGVSAVALGAQADAQYRTEAASFTNEIAQTMWVGVNRTSVASIATDLATYSHQPTEDAATPCTFSGSASTNALVTDWATRVRARLPGATNVMQQIIVGTGPTDFNRVTITVCWQTANDNVPRRHTLVTLVN